MKQINNFIQEKLKINSKSKIDKYNYHPKDKEELQDILRELIYKRGRIADLNDIDTSAITDMSRLFFHLDKYFHGDISKWNVSNVEDMSGMFYGMKYFNCDISNWDVSNVKKMSVMFAWCENFDCNLNDWDVSNVTDMKSAFQNSALENHPPKWYTWKPAPIPKVRF